LPISTTSITNYSIYAVVGLVFLLFFRRAIIQILLALLGLVCLSITVAAGGALGYLLSGPGAAVIGGIASGLAIIYACSRNSRSTNGYDSAHRDFDDDNDGQRLHEEQLREDRRMQDLHEDARQRNPW
jgi:hypothetical protein